MLTALLDPFRSDFMLHALFGGALVAVICAVVGTWVVIRGMAFLGEALGHGMLPGVALASLLGVPVLVGGAASAVVMSALIGLLQRRGRLSYDTSIGLLFVAMLSAGVIIISHSRSFATDATALLFGELLALSGADLLVLSCAAVVTIVASSVFHRGFVAVAFDPRLARTLGLRPQLSQFILVGLVTLAVVSAFQAVGTLLVVGLLLAPAVAAGPWTRRIPVRMVAAAGFGVAAVVLGLLVSWHLGSAAGASITAAAIALAAASAALRPLLRPARSATTPSRPTGPVREPAPEHANASSTE